MVRDRAPYASKQNRSRNSKQQNIVQYLTNNNYSNRPRKITINAATVVNQNKQRQTSTD